MDGLGLCEACIPLSIKADALEDLKKEQRLALSRRDRDEDAKRNC